MGSGGENAKETSETPTIRASEIEGEDSHTENECFGIGDKEVKPDRKGTDVPDSTHAAISVIIKASKTNERGKGDNCGEAVDDESSKAKMALS